MQYRRATALHLLPMLAHEYNIIIDSCVSEIGHGKEVVDGINTIEIKKPMLTARSKFPGSRNFYSQMEIHISINIEDICLER